ncbi:MAG: hypothetical protein JWN78_460 [Bacteroidota bacterium]|nr:hypothetical protein [Bacteroidota bacterium]
MYRIVLSLIVCFTFVFARAQTINLTEKSPEIYCTNGVDSFSATWSNVPANSNIVFYQSTNPLFNPYLGQGDSIGFIHIDASNTTSNPIVSVCPRILGIFIDACNDLGRSEPANEYILITSGNAGFLPSTLQIDLPSNTDINMGAGACNFQTPSAALMTLLRTGTCNAANLIPAGPADFIPANALVIVFTGNGTDYPYNFSSLCSTNQPVYILQNACTQGVNNGSFVNNGNPICANLMGTRYRTTFIFTPGCSDELTYDRCGLQAFNMANPNAGDGNYAIHLTNTDTSSVGNGGIQNNAADKCNGVVLDSILKTQTITYNIPNDGSANPATNFCNTGFHYIKAITHPNGTQPVSNAIKFKLICLDVTSTTPNSTICSGSNAVINNSSSDATATFSWTVTAGTNITGAAAGTGNTINQTLTNTGNTKDSVIYNITSKDSFCTAVKSVTINVNPKPVKPNLGNDTSFCGTFSKTLSTGDATTSWQRNGTPYATGASINITQTGTYIATITSSCGNVADTIGITPSALQPPINLGRDTNYCGVFSRVLSTGNNTTVWSTGVTASQITITQPGTYWARITGSCGTVSDTIIITQSSGLVFSFGGNTTICSGSTVSLDAGVGYDSYLWSTGEITHFIVISSAGKYWAQVTKNGCSGSDTILVREIFPPTFNSTLGSDTTYCDSFSTVLSTGNNQTKWFRNGTQVSIGPSFTISQNGTYIAKASNSCGIIADTIVINTAAAIPLELGRDTAICIGDSIVLNARVPGVGITYLWKHGEQTPTITVSQVDRYWVEVSNGSCTVRDTIFVDVINPPNALFLGNDTSFCGTFSKQLTTGEANTTWSTGQTGQQILIDKPGTYIAENKNQCGSEKDTIVIQQFPLPVLSLRSDTTICDSVILSIGNGNFNSVLWSTNDTTNSILVTTGGLYSVRVSDSVCTNSDSVRIKKECFYDVYIPTGFTPNGDGLNDILVPLSHIRGMLVLQYDVFDRWGELVFESQNFIPGDVTHGWNGTYKGANSQVDSYTYFFIAKMPDDQVKTYKGTVLLLR